MFVFNFFSRLFVVSSKTQLFHYYRFKTEMALEGFNHHHLFETRKKHLSTKCATQTTHRSYLLYFIRVRNGCGRQIKHLNNKLYFNMLK